MACYLYAAGSGGKNVVDYKRKIGYHQLLSQYAERKALLEWVDYLREHPECKCKLFVDSGAYTAHTKGVDIDVDEYIKLINDITDQVTVFAQVDKIPGRWGQPKTVEQVMSAPKESWDNYLYMVNKIKEPQKLLPIFHQGEDFKWLENMINYQYTEGPLKGKYIEYIGISCNKELPSKEWIPWFEKCFETIRNSNNPNVKTHAFGMTSLKIIEQFPFTSSDSTTWLKFAAYGSILIKGKPYYISNRNELGEKHIESLTPQVKEEIIKELNRLGFKYEDVLNDEKGDMRLLVNLASLKDWCDNYEYKGSLDTKTELW